ncbi:MAG TPA: hypothetical protein VFK33_13865 [Bacillales bacterium]|nr:hypothetical protein [Bacillales bacterium]
MNYGPYDPYGYFDNPSSKNRDMYIYDDSYVADETDMSKVVSELKKINKKLDSIDKKVKSIEQKMGQRMPQPPNPFYY